MNRRDRRNKSGYERAGIFLFGFAIVIYAALIVWTQAYWVIAAVFIVAAMLYGLRWITEIIDNGFVVIALVLVLLAACRVGYWVMVMGAR